MTTFIRADVKFVLYYFHLNFKTKWHLRFTFIKTHTHTQPCLGLCSSAQQADLCWHHKTVVASWYFLAICPALLYNRSLWAVIFQLLQWVTCWMTERKKKKKGHRALICFYHNFNSWLCITVKFQANKSRASRAVRVLSVYAVQSSSAGR